HAGAELREVVCGVLREAGVQVVDVGTFSTESTDYPLFAEAVARKVASGEADLGVLVCGTGVGMAIAANKIAGAYAAHASDPYTARMAREHNAANILTLGARVVGAGLAAEIVRAFISATPSPEARHERRREQVRKIEAGGCPGIGVHRDG
ncbi:MAG: ribose 5-phosphate isomerase B, partial [Armatimonadetes bacterium]|nr:ribose 5-phosphate isomerase B [Armatimonadota bacterium]